MLYLDKLPEFGWVVTHQFGSFVVGLGIDSLDSCLYQGVQQLGQSLDHYVASLIFQCQVAVFLLEIQDGLVLIVQFRISFIFLVLQDFQHFGCGAAFTCRMICDVRIDHGIDNLSRLFRVRRFKRHTDDVILFAHRGIYFLLKKNDKVIYIIEYL